MSSTRFKVVGNSLALLANQITQNATSFILSLSIARILGPYELGQYTLAFTFYFIFMTMSSQGLKTFLTREIARDPDKIQTCLISGTLLQACFSLLAYAALFVLILVLPYKRATMVLCWIVGAALIPYGISNVTEAIFQAQERMHLITISTVPIYILRLILMFIGLKTGVKLNIIGMILVASEAIILFIEWFWVLRLTRPIHWKIDREFIWRTIKSIRALMVIEGVSTLQSRIPYIFLSIFATETIVGLYGAVIQLIQPFQIVSLSVMQAVFPGLSKAAEQGENGRETQRHLTERTLETLLIAAMPLIIGAFFVGRDLLPFLFRNPVFGESATALNIVMLGAIALSVTRSLSYLLVANRLERFNLKEVIRTTTMGTFLCLILTPQFQLVGVAVATLLTQITGASQYVYAVYTRLFWLRLWRVLRRPLLISLGMICILSLLQMAHTSILLTLVIAVAAYSLMIAAVGIRMLGSPAALRAYLMKS